METLKCKDCDYCAPNNWDLPGTFFCEIKEETNDNYGNTDRTILPEDKACEKFVKIGEG